MDKKSLRRFVRAEKRKYGEAELARLSCGVVQTLLCHPRVAAANTVLLYHALPDEVDTSVLLSSFLKQGKKVLLPKVTSDTEMTIHEYLGEHKLLREDAFGIMEPDGGNPFTDFHSIDLMIIPGMAFDEDGHRLGRGKGYYDRFLSGMPCSIYKIGVCFPFQLVATVPCESTDVAMDEVVTCSAGILPSINNNLF